MTKIEQDSFLMSSMHALENNMITSASLNFSDSAFLNDLASKLIYLDQLWFRKFVT